MPREGDKLKELLAKLSILQPGDPEYRSLLDEIIELQESLSEEAPPLSIPAPLPRILKEHLSAYLHADRVGEK